MDESLATQRRRIASLKDRLEADSGIPPAELVQLLDQLVLQLSDIQARLDASARNQAGLEQRMERIENSVVFRTLRGIGGVFRDLRRTLGQTLLHSPLHPVYARLTGDTETADREYRQWSETLESQLPSADQERTQSALWSCQPLMSIAIPTWNPNHGWLQQAVDSVRAQSYDNWELCLSVDGPADAALQTLLDTFTCSDQRIRVTTSPQRSGISAALNNAAQLIGGEYVAFLDHDDLLSPHALHSVVLALQNGPVDLLYSDEDRLDTAGRRIRPNFKPDWSPDLLTSCMYMGHLLVVSRKQLDAAGWFRSEYDGAQDYDLVLRLSDSLLRVVHLSGVLYHWRMHSGSTAAEAAAKPYAHEAGRRALADAMQRRGQKCNIIDGPIVHTYNLQPLSPSPGVAVIICSRNSALLARCLRSVVETTLVDTKKGIEPEIVVVHHQAGGSDPDMDRVFERFQCRPVIYTGEFNFAAMNNLGAQHTDRELLLFLNDDVTALHAGWLERLLFPLSRPGVGVVGARLNYPNGAIQHAGIALGAGEATGHMGRHQFRSDLWPWLELRRNVSAVTAACMAIRRSLFQDVGGFDPEFRVNYNDVDLCLRLAQAGYSILCDSSVILRHDECGTRSGGTRIEERDRFLRRWGTRLRAPDPFYSPFLSHRDEEIALEPVKSAPGKRVSASI